ncbi:MAG TPA: hypothetical protein VFS51_00955 [Gemmatimonadales bacterium]|nr:hypothetical protein [Gemmatimonadales bacterium]
MVPRSIDLLQLASSFLSNVVGFAALVVLALAGCDGERSVAVRVSIPNADSIETPAAGVGVIALPYDRDSIIASLESRAPTPRPHTAELESLFARFRGPFAAYTNLSFAASTLRDSLDALQRSVDAAPEGSAQRGALSAQVRRLSDSLTALKRRVARARTDLDRARSVFVTRSDTLRSAVRRWEDSTYQGYDSIVANLTNTVGREPTTDTTNATGWAALTLPPRRWWLYARAWDPTDPNAEWYWNVPVEDDTVLLSSRTGDRRPRY